jgi:hypothetical protein
VNSPALLRFPSDVPFRRQLQPPGARRHPGKLHLGFLAYLLTAHAPRGGRLLDPFAGSGGLLLATLPPWGCDVLLNELEPQWVAQCEAAWAHLQASPAAPRGTAQIVQGDARALQAGGFAGLITSPPYADQFGLPSNMGIEPRANRPQYHEARRNGYRAGYDAVITSPSYADAMNGQGGSAVMRKINAGYQGAYDALLTSPPYSDALSHQRHGPDYHPERTDRHGPENDSMTMQRRGYAGAARNPAQIGNLAGARYWAAMAEVWAACVPLVRPGGVLVVVLKNIVRGNAEVDLIGGTRAQLEALGCRYVTTHYRAVAPGPFHRIRQKSRPDALVIDREGALVLEAP